MKSKEILLERVKVLRALDTIAHTFNDEYAIEMWLECGVPDEEITDTTKDDEIMWLVEDEKEWQELLDLFVKLIRRASADGIHNTLWTE